MTEATTVTPDASRRLLEERRRLLIREVNAISTALGLPGVRVDRERAKKT